VLPRSHWFDTDFRPCNDAYIATYKVLTRDHLRNRVPSATCIRPSSGRYRSISSETPTTALSLERRCAARTRRFLSAAIPFIDSLSTQSATTPPSSLSGEERNIRLFGWRWPGSPTAHSGVPTLGGVRGRATIDDRTHTTINGDSTVRQAQGTSPHHRKVLYFPAKIMVPLRATQAESKRANTNK